MFVLGHRISPVSRCPLVVPLVYLMLRYSSNLESAVECAGGYPLIRGRFPPTSRAS